MYQIHVWNRTFWDDNPMPQIYTTQQEAVEEALIKTRQDFTLHLCAVMEDGYDMPRVVVYDGRRFNIEPLSDADVA